MIAVFPAPVAPTIATLSAAEILKLTSRRTQSPSLYAKLTFSNVISPRTWASSRGCGGAAGVALLSGRREKNSHDALPARLMLFFSARSPAGWEKRWAGWHNAGRGPDVLSPFLVQKTPP